MNPGHVEPSAVAEVLIAQGEPAIKGATPTVSLGVEDGRFVLNWSGEAKKWDWVALYGNPGAPQDQYLRGQWQWAVKATSYKTGTRASNNYEARYLRWNGSEYEVVAKTDPFKS